MHTFKKVIFVNEFLRYVAEFDADILRAFQWNLEVEVADFKGDILGSLAREETVDDKFEYIK